MNIKIVSIIAIVLLLLGIPTGWPYGYYIFLRWVITLSAVFIAYQAYKLEKDSWIYIFAGIAILFNPIAPIYLDKSVWVLIDMISSVLFATFGFSKLKGDE